MTVSILTLNWENWPATRRCLESLTSLRQWGTSQLSVIVVDNDSQDGSAQQIAHWVHEHNRQLVTFLRAEGNQGFASGNNIGLRWLLGQSSLPEFVWLLNNDTVVEPNTLSELLDAARENPGVRVWGSTVLSESDGSVEYGGGGFYSPLLSVQRRHLAGSSRHEAVRREVMLGLDFVCAASMLVRSEFLVSQGLLNEQYFMYFEELDLCRRLNASTEIGWCPASVVVHAGGSSTSDSRKGLSTRQFHENLSAFKFTAINHRSCLLFVLLLRFLVKPLLFVARRQVFLFAPWFRSYLTFFRWRRARVGQPDNSC
jgi:GT2 family glycosyltransferase